MKHFLVKDGVKSKFGVLSEFDRVSCFAYLCDETTKTLPPFVFDWISENRVDLNSKFNVITNIKELKSIGLDKVNQSQSKKFQRQSRQKSCKGRHGGGCGKAIGMDGGKRTKCDISTSTPSVEECMEDSNLGFEDTMEDDYDE